QRAAIARALVARPRLILADEPTGNLDSVNGAAVLDLLAETVAEAGAALLLVTHDPGAGTRAVRTLHLRDGRLEGDTHRPGRPPGARHRVQIRSR
ncbi:MAG: macrolide ABC transporter ATP-binding protein, partial [Acidimicrobiales bacterium]